MHEVCCFAKHLVNEDTCMMSPGSISTRHAMAGNKEVSLRRHCTAYLHCLTWMIPWYVRRSRWRVACFNKHSLGRLTITKIFQSQQNVGTESKTVTLEARQFLDVSTSTQFLESFCPSQPLGQTIDDGEAGCLRLVRPGPLAYTSYPHCWRIKEIRDALEKPYRSPSQYKHCQHDGNSLPDPMNRISYRRLL